MSLPHCLWPYGLGQPYTCICLGTSEVEQGVGTLALDPRAQAFFQGDPAPGDPCCGAWTHRLVGLGLQPEASGVEHVESLGHCGLRY